MSIPRDSDAANHLARKPRRRPKLRPEIIPIDQAPTTDLLVLTDEPASISRCANNPANPGEPR